MRIAAAFLACLALSACGTAGPLGSILEPTAYVTAYHPFAIIYEPARFEVDRKVCAAKAATLPTGIDVGAVAVDTVNGGLSNATGAIASPVVPAIGAASAGTGDILHGIGLATPQKIHSMIMCMTVMTLADHSGVVMDPS